MDQPWRALAGLLSLLYQPAFKDILPVFIWRMLLLRPLSGNGCF
ncbi:MAG: hypothetical protein EXR05_10675 [Acetobacteraceae bacterium]|nr:hypothetical protein [Acetobacteraceae bacterium]MSP29725.1 hypothetical protein [Acetobacteraceae bacterium]